MSVPEEILSQMGQCVCGNLLLQGVKMLHYITINERAHLSRKTSINGGYNNMLEIKRCGITKEAQKACLYKISDFIS